MASESSMFCLHCLYSLYMFDKLEDLLIRYEELMSELSEPDVANNPERFRKLMKEQSDILPIVEAYKEYKQCKQNIEDSLAMLEEQADEEMTRTCKRRVKRCKEPCRRIRE